jgi:hypothetical protein
MYVLVDGGIGHVVCVSDLFLGVCLCGGDEFEPVVSSLAAFLQLPAVVWASCFELLERWVGAQCGNCSQISKWCSQRIGSQE